MNKKLMLGISAVILVIAFITGVYMGAEGGSKTSTAGKAREKNTADMTKAATKSCTLHLMTDHRTLPHSL